MQATYLKKIRFLLVIFISGLVLSGLTAFPIQTQLEWLLPCFNETSLMGGWLYKTYEGVSYINTNYPFLSYGTDWLGFAHLMIAIVFLGAIKDPVKNIWVIQFGMISCVAVFPQAFIAGGIRGIPLFWQLIDCSFGAVGIIPLLIAYRLTRKLETIA